jgi:hypothetical protein
MAMAGAEPRSLADTPVISAGVIQLMKGVRPERSLTRALRAMGSAPAGFRLSPVL